MNGSADSSFAKWTVPECPFAIEYSLRVLDEIRLVVVDAFFSLPRGGVEIGGILLGSAVADRVTIVESVPLECEHALGPSFTLSPNDLAKLESQLAGLPTAGSARPVGWYHSHTRSEIFLSDSDLEIHRRFFPDPRQVALVLRPHTFEPVRAGFFFRQADGSMYAEAAYQEFHIDPLPAHPRQGHSRAKPTAPPPAPTPPASKPVAPPPPPTRAMPPAPTPLAETPLTTRPPALTPVTPPPTRAMPPAPPPLAETPLTT